MPSMSCTSKTNTPTNINPPQTPHTSPKNKIAWIVVDQPLKFK